MSVAGLAELQRNIPKISSSVISGDPLLAEGNRQEILDALSRIVKLVPVAGLMVYAINNFMIPGGKEIMAEKNMFFRLMK